MNHAQTLRFRVSGRVQGVGFRMFVYKTARKIDLSGFVRNLEDGSVEVIARGDASQLQELESALWKGPWLAKVSSVERSVLNEYAEQPYPFEIKT